MERFLGDYCTEIHGVDVSGIRVGLAKKRHRGYNNVYFHKNKGRDLSILRDERFDFVLSEQVLRHIEKEDTVFLIEEMHRILKPKGKVSLQLPNILAPSYLKMALWTH